MILVRRSYERLARNERQPNPTLREPGGFRGLARFFEHLSSGYLSVGLQDADADDLAQQVLASVARAVEHWTPAADGPPFRAWLYRIAHHEIIKSVTRRKPDAGVGSSRVQEMLQAIPQREQELSEELVRECRMEAFRWAAEEVKQQFTPTTWAMSGKPASRAKRSNQLPRVTSGASEPSTCALSRNETAERKAG